MPSYVSLNDMKAWLGEKTTDNDAQISSAILVASSLIAGFCEYELLAATKTETIFGNGSKSLFPRRLPITAVASCMENGVAVPVSFHPEAITRTDGYVFQAHAPVQVAFTAGYDPLPDDVVHAAMLTAQAVYNSPAFDQNFQSENVAGVFSGAYHQFGPGNVPPAARLMLERYRSRI